jgi:NitT/TauT family transport system substrate-binding protein
MPGGCGLTAATEPPNEVRTVENGLPLVVLTGGDVMLKSERMMGLARNPGVSSNTPSDLIGKKVGVQGLNAFMHVLLRKWLMEKGVD